MGDMLSTKNIIFSGLLKASQEGMELRRQEYLKTFSDPKVFEDEYYIFALLVKDFPKLTLSKNFVEHFLIANRPSLEKSSNINLSKYKYPDKLLFIAVFIKKNAPWGVWINGQVPVGTILRP